MPKRALMVGFDHYNEVSCLSACVADAIAVADCLSRNSDRSSNYDCQTLVAPRGSPVGRAELRGAIRRLFESYRGDILFYFSGHGALTETGGFIAASDATANDEGVGMHELIRLANESKARDICLMLDCCHSGDLGNTGSQAGQNLLSELRDGITIIAASGRAEAAVEAGGHGLFTAAVLDALNGGAADHTGWVTAPSVYAYVYRRFGGWAQHPVFKTNTSQLTVLRCCEPLIERLKLDELVKLFPEPSATFPLDPEFEPEDEHGNVHGPVNDTKLRVSKLLKDFRDAGLLRPSTAHEQLFWTARLGHTVELTPRGREYWRLVKSGKI